MKNRKCKFCGNKFKPSQKHVFYCSTKCGEKGSIIVHHQWYVKHKKTILKRQKNNPNKPRVQRKATLKQKYGLTLEQYNQMIIKQRGLCNICKKQPKILYVDHDHKTGKVRKLLCQKCNTALGFFDDSVNILRAAIKHIRDNEL